MIQLTPRNRVEEFARAEYARHYGQPQPTEVVNYGPVMGLLDGDLLVYRERSYRSPPVSYRDGVRLFEIADRLAKMVGRAGEDAAAQMRAIVHVQGEAVRLFHALVTPTDWRRFIPRALLPNPFRSASPQEVDDLLGFFWTRQTTSTVRLPRGAAGGRG